MPDLHSRIASELSRRLEVAKAATPGPLMVVDPNEGSEHLPFWMVVNDAFLNPPADEDTPWIAVELHTGVREDAEHIAIHDPADSIRRYSSALRVLERHAIIHRNIGWLELDDGELVECSAEVPVCGTCVPKHSHFKSRAEVREGACIEVRDLAASLGLDTEGSTTDG